MGCLRKFTKKFDGEAEGGVQMSLFFKKGKGP